MASAPAGSLLERPKISGYDLLGYLVPGSIFLAAVACFEAWAREVLFDVAREIHTPVYSAGLRVFGFGSDSLSASMSRAGSESPPGAILQVALLAIMVSVVYVVGHVIASVSAFAIDRAYVSKAHGYPFQRLLRITDAKSSKADFYRSLFFAVNLYLVSQYLSLPNSLALKQLLPDPLSAVVTWFDVIPVENIWKLISIVLEAAIVILVVLKVLLSARDFRLNYAVGRWTTLHSRVRATLSLTAALPRWITHMLGRYIHTDSKFSETEVADFQTRLRKVCGRGVSLADSSAYWTSLMLVREKHPTLAAASDVWLQLYGFARNVAAAFFLAFLYCMVWWSEHANFLAVDSAARSVLFAVPLIYLLAAFAMLLRYYYLYFDYYSKYLIRCVLYSDI